MGVIQQTGHRQGVLCLPYGRPFQGGLVLETVYLRH